MTKAALDLAVYTFEVQRGQQSKKPVHTLEKETEKSLLKKKI